MAGQYKDNYQILEIPRNAGDEEIRKAFRRLARKYHPDVAGNHPGAENKFKDINEAYEVLCDPERRLKFNSINPRTNPDSRGSNGSKSSGAGPRNSDYEFGGAGFSDFFDTLFGKKKKPNPTPSPEQAATDS